MCLPWWPFPPNLHLPLLKMAVVSRLGCYSSTLRGSQTRLCCLPQSHPSRTPFTSVPVNVGKNRELCSYEVPHSCFHSESSPESTPHWSLPARNSWSLAGPGRAAFWLRTAICSSRLLPVCHWHFSGLSIQGPVSWSSELSTPFFLTSCKVSILQLTLHVLLFVYCLLSLIKR